jgi:hypothetical protein
MKSSGVYANGKKISKAPLIVSDGNDRVILNGVTVKGDFVAIDKTGEEKKILGRPVKRRRKTA